MTHMEDKFYKSVPLLLKSIDKSLNRIANSLEETNRLEQISIESMQDLQKMLELHEAQTYLTNSMLCSMNIPFPIKTQEK